VVKREFQELQIGVLNHPVTVIIIKLWAVTVKSVKIKLYNKQLSFSSK